MDEQTIKLTATVKRLIRETKDPQEAAVKLSFLGEEAVSILCSLARIEGRRRNCLRWFSLGLTLLGIGINLILIVTVPRESRQLYQVLATSIYGVGAIATALLSAHGGRTTKLLAGLDDARLVAPLLDVIAAHSRDGVVTDTIRGSLSRLLPRLKASDASRLLPRHIEALNKEIDLCRAWKWGDADEIAYALVVFRALEQVGDETSVPVVEQVVSTTQHVQVREAAEACLPFLRQRAAQGKNTLLRASHPNVTDLLLSAQGGEHSEPAVLLRPHSSQSQYPPL